MDIFTELRTYSYFMHFSQCTNISRSRTGRNCRTMGTAVVTRNGWSLAVFLLQVFWDSLSNFMYKPIRRAMGSGRTRTAFGPRCVVVTHRDAHLSQANGHRLRSAFYFFRSSWPYPRSHLFIFSHQYLWSSSLVSSLTLFDICCTLFCWFWPVRYSDL